MGGANSRTLYFYEHRPQQPYEPKTLTIEELLNLKCDPVFKTAIEDAMGDTTALLRKCQHSFNSYLYPLHTKTTTRGRKECDTEDCLNNILTSRDYIQREMGVFSAANVGSSRVSKIMVLQSSYYEFNTVNEVERKAGSELSETIGKTLFQNFINSNKIQFLIAKDFLIPFMINNHDSPTFQNDLKDEGKISS